jgi:hypothetical protein
LFTHKENDVQELLLAELGRQDGIKDVLLEEDELSNGSLSDDELDGEVVGIFNSCTDPKI